VAIGEGRIVFARRSPGADPRVQLVSDSLLAPDTRVIAEFPRAESLGDFDWDGTRASWAQASCAGGSIRTQDVGAASPDPLEPEPCPAQILSRRLEVDSAKRIAVRVRCARGCQGRLALGLAGTQGAPLAIARGQTATVRIELGRRARQQLEVGPDVRTVAVRAVTSDLLGRRKTTSSVRLPLRLR
jgi:hypothetical protein